MARGMSQYRTGGMCSDAELGKQYRHFPFRADGDPSRGDRLEACATIYGRPT
jgi:hypothetical protein